MSYVAVVVIVLAVLAFVFRDKLAPLVEKLKGKVKPADVAKPEVAAAAPKPAAFDWGQFSGWTLFDVMRRLGRQLDPHEIAAAKAAGVIVPEDVKPEPARDYSGFALENGSYKVNSQVAGVAQEYTFTLPANQASTVSVEGTEGTSFGSATIELQDSSGALVESRSGPVTATGGMRLDERSRPAGAYKALVTVYDPAGGSKRVLVTLHYS